MDFVAFTGTPGGMPWRLSDVIPARMVSHTLRTWTCSHLPWRGQSSRPPAVSPSRVRPTAVSAIGTHFDDDRIVVGISNVGQVIQTAVRDCAGAENRLAVL